MSIKKKKGPGRGAPGRPRAPGGGRKPKAVKKVAYTTKLDPALVAWLRAQPNQARAIEAAIVGWYGLSV